MKVAIIGTGYVGLVTGACLAEIGNDVLCIDNNTHKIDMLKAGEIPIFEPGLKDLVARNIKAGRLRFSPTTSEGVEHAAIIYIAVSTPSRPDGGADLSYVETVAREVAVHMRDYKIIVDKSTVPVNTGEKVAETISRYRKTDVPFDVVSNPEFLREGSAIQDTMHPDRIVIGVSSSKAAQVLTELYAPFKAPVIVTDIKSAEIIKHASNSFLAMKIAFANAVARLCDATGADIRQVTYGMGLDPRIGASFLNAGIGYGGSCFPKDISAFIKIAENTGYDFHLLKSVEQVNREQMQYFIKKIHDTFWVLKGKTFAVWGLSFKPNTDDMRDSPAIPVIRHLHEEGAVLRAFDPEAMGNARGLLPPIEFGTDPYSILKGCDGLIIHTEWDVFQNADLRKVRAAMGQPIIVDGRNLFELDVMESLGFEYVSIGRRMVKPVVAVDPAV